MFAAQGVGNCAQGISRQAANPVARYLQIPVCESISLLKFICNPKVGIHNTFAVIADMYRAAKNPSHWMQALQTEVKSKQRSAFCSEAACCK